MYKVIERKIDRLERLVQIIQSMRKPQVRFKLGMNPANPFSETLEMHAQNYNGICLYTFKGETRGNELLLKQIDNMPREIFIDNFKSYEKETNDTLQQKRQR